MTYSSGTGCVCGSNYQAAGGTCVSDTDVSTLGGFGSTNNNYNILNYNAYIVLKIRKYRDQEQVRMQFAQPTLH
jgi:hypothetical protein